jgi:hypothetical protein
MTRRDRNWTIVQLFFHDPVKRSGRHPMGWAHREEKYVIEVGTKKEAEAIFGRWVRADPERGSNLHAAHYYPRNYVADFRTLKAAGRVIADG